MDLLFFALDLRTFSPALLAEIKLCLLELANMYALSAPTSNVKCRNFESSLENRIGLGYIQRSASSFSDELKVAYSPRETSFNLRDFHHAVNCLPSDSYSPLSQNNSGSFLLHDAILSCILNDEVLYSAGGKVTKKKVILISACLDGNMDSNARKTLQDAEDRCIYVEFVYLKNLNKFGGLISDLFTCSSDANPSDGQELNGRAKRWLRELKENNEGLMAYFEFQGSITDSINRLSCRLCRFINQILDEFSLCETHGYHEIQRNNGEGFLFKECLLNQVKMHEESIDTDHNSTSIGEDALLMEAAGQCWKNLRKVPSAVIFNVIEKTELGSLNKGVMIGRPYRVIPSVVVETNTTPEESDMNNKLFQGLWHALKSQNYGLICRSYCNLEIMRETTLVHHYILLPSDDGVDQIMLLRRLAGAEETLPCLDANLNDASMPDGFYNSILQYLSGMESIDYKAKLHCGGFHQKLNQLIEKSSQPRPGDPEISTTPSSFTSPDDAAASFDVVVVSPDDVVVSSQPCLVKDVAAPPPKDDRVPSLKDNGIKRNREESEEHARKRCCGSKSCSSIHVDEIYRTDFDFCEM